MLSPINFGASVVTLMKLFVSNYYLYLYKDDINVPFKIIAINRMDYDHLPIFRDLSFN